MSEDVVMRDEASRLAALETYGILDTLPETQFNDIVAIAAEICGTPMALISLVDDRRQWFKAAVGLDVPETPREIAFCAHAIGQDETFVVEDAAADPRFADNPLVTGEPSLRFYAGAQLVTPGGHALGTLCVLDRQAGTLPEAKRLALEALARQVIAQLELRKVLGERQREEERRRMILESAVDYAIVSMDVNGQVTSWNEGARRILGWKEDEMCGRPADVFFTPEDRRDGIPAQEMHNAVTKGRGADERWHLRKSGDRFWGFGEMMPLRDPDGRHEGFLKIFRDRTEQHEAAQALERSEARFQLALGAAGFLGAWDWDVGADLIYADERFAEMYSVTPEQAQAGLPLDSFVAGIHPDDRGWVGESIALAVETCGEFAEEYRLLHADGRVFWVAARGRCLCDDQGRPTHFPGVAVDITDRRAMEDALRASETRTRLALEATDMGAWESPQDLSELLWDARTRHLLGHGPDDEVSFATFLDHVLPADRERVNATVTAALATPDGLLDIEYRVLSLGGGQHWVHVRGRLVSEGLPSTRFIGTIRDVTAQKAAEERGALLAGELQHRIKNMLAVVQAIVSQSLRRAATPAEAGEAIGERLGALARAHDLLTDTSWNAAPLALVVEGAVRVHGARGDRVTVAGPDVRLNAKSALGFSLALHELATNAVKYGALSNEEGMVEVCWRRSDADARELEFAWIERGGPDVTQPAREGFGSRLMRGLSRDLGGASEADYRSSGLTWRLRSSLDAIEEPAGSAADGTEK